MDINANLNNTECLVRRSHLGYDTIINICSGKHIDVSWAIGNWAYFVVDCFAGLIVLGLSLGLIALVYAGLTNRW